MRTFDQTEFVSPLLGLVVAFSGDTNGIAIDYLVMPNGDVISAEDLGHVADKLQLEAEQYVASLEDNKASVFYDNISDVAYDKYRQAIVDGE